MYVLAGDCQCSEFPVLTSPVNSEPILCPQYLDVSFTRNGSTAQEVHWKPESRHMTVPQRQKLDSSWSRRKTVIHHIPTFWSLLQPFIILGKIKPAETQRLTLVLVYWTAMMVIGHMPTAKFCTQPCRSYSHMIHPLCHTSPTENEVQTSYQQP